MLPITFIFLEQSLKGKLCMLHNFLTLRDILMIFDRIIWASPHKGSLAWYMTLQDITVRSNVKFMRLFYWLMSLSRQGTTIALSLYICTGRSSKLFANYINLDKRMSIEFQPLYLAQLGRKWLLFKGELLCYVRMASISTLCKLFLTKIKNNVTQKYHILNALY